MGIPNLHSCCNFKEGFKQRWVVQDMLFKIFVQFDIPLLENNSIFPHQCRGEIKMMMAG